MTFTPPSDMSVMVQSRGNPVGSWILARLLHTRRSLLRRFINMFDSWPQSNNASAAFQVLLTRNYWNLTSGTPRNLTILLTIFYRDCLAGRRQAELRRKCGVALEETLLQAWI
jgi:hypothetical protein